MNIIVSEFDFFFFMFITATFYAISAYLFIKYWKNGDAIKEEIDSIINQAISKYIEQAEKLSYELEIEKKEQYKNIRDMQNAHFESERKINDLIEKFEVLENKLNKGIVERDGKISRKNREIEKLKERIKKLEKDNEC